jgi:F-type H+-transporting ATPase subunit gamma
MPSLKEYRNRIVSVKSTRKITSAMKMVAASKLKKAQEQAEASQPYARAMASMMARVAANLPDGSGPRLLVGTGKSDVHLLVVVTSDRGLCGGFNANLLRRARLEIRRLQGEGKTVKIVCVGRKGRDSVRRTYATSILESFINLGGRKRISFAEADQITQLVLDQFATGGFDVCTLIYNEFKSVLVQKPSALQLIPFSVPATSGNDNKKSSEEDAEKQHYEFEPNEAEIMEKLLPRNLGVQIFRAMLDSAAGEQAARMTAMDNATRNAGDLINRLTLQYNRARQAHITKELIEIISGAEAV